MSNTIFEQVKKAAGSQQRSSSWYKRQVRQLAKNYDTIDEFARDETLDSLDEDGYQDSNQLRNEVRKGHLYLFEYEASTKYKYYDAFPLVYVVDRGADYFIGANFHYMQPKYRAIAIKTLFEKNKLVVPKKTLHKYISSNVSGRFLDLGKDEWETAIYLPVENFLQERNGRDFPYKKKDVWDATYKAYRDRYTVQRLIESY